MSQAASTKISYAPPSLDSMSPYVEATKSTGRFPTSGCEEYKAHKDGDSRRECGTRAQFWLHGKNFRGQHSSSSSVHFSGIPDSMFEAEGFSNCVPVDSDSDTNLAVTSESPTTMHMCACVVLEHSHERLRAELPPGLGYAAVTVSTGSTEKKRRSRKLSYRYDPPQINTVWSGPALRSLKVSSVFDASSPAGQSLYVFGENFGESASEINITLNGEPCLNAEWNLPSEDTKPPGFPYLTCNPIRTTVGPKDILVSLGNQSRLTSRLRTALIWRHSVLLGFTA